VLFASARTQRRFIFQILKIVLLLADRSGLPLNTVPYCAVLAGWLAGFGCWPSAVCVLGILFFLLLLAWSRSCCFCFCFCFCCSCCCLLPHPYPTVCYLALSLLTFLPPGLPLHPTSPHTTGTLIDSPHLIQYPSHSPPPPSPSLPTLPPPSPSLAFTPIHRN